MTERKRSQNQIFFVGILILILSVWSCQKTPNGFNDQYSTYSEDGTFLTGANKIIPSPQGPSILPYTGLGHEKDLSEIKKNADQNSYDPHLGRQVVDAEVTTTPIPTTSTTPSSSPPMKKNLRVRLDLANPQSTSHPSSPPTTTSHSHPSQTLIFDVPLKKLSDGKIGNRDIPANNPTGNYKLDATCKDGNCNKVEFLLKKSNEPPASKKSSHGPSIPFLYTAEQREIETRTENTSPESPDSSENQGDKTQTENHSTDPLSDQQPIRTGTATQHNIEFLGGPSFAKVEIPSSNDQPPITVRFDAVTTDQQTTPLTQVQIGNESSEGTLMGNSGNGDVVIQVKETTPQPKKQLEPQKNQKIQKPPSTSSTHQNRPANKSLKTPPEVKPPKPAKKPEAIPLRRNPKLDSKPLSNSHSEPPPPKSPPATPKTLTIIVKPNKIPPSTDSPQSKKDPDDGTGFSNNQAVIPVETNDQLPYTHQITQLMEPLRKNPFVNQHIQSLINENQYRRCGNGSRQNKKPSLIAFLRNMAALAPHANLVFSHPDVDMTPEVLYISFLESAFAVKDNWPIEAVRCRNQNHCSTAAGPFQFTRTTSNHMADIHDLNFTALGFTSGNRVSSRDDRSYFLPSSLLLALYTKDLTSWFPQHPELWPLGYTEGQGKLALIIKCASQPDAASRSQCLRRGDMNSAYRERERYKNINLSEIVTYKMAPCDRLDYVLDYLAIKFIGSNPNHFGISIDKSRLQNVPERVLYRPGQNSHNFFSTMFKRTSRTR